MGQNELESRSRSAEGSSRARRDRTPIRYGNLPSAAAALQSFPSLRLLHLVIPDAANSGNGRFGVHFASETPISQVPCQPGEEEKGETLIARLAALRSTIFRPPFSLARKV